MDGATSDTPEWARDEARFPGNTAAYAMAQEAVRAEEAVAFVGAGASAPLYPLWSGLVRQLTEAARARGLVREDEMAAFERNDPQTVAEELRRLMGEGLWRDELDSAFDEQRDPESGEVQFTEKHEALMRLPFLGYVTTNYDPGLIFARTAVLGPRAGTGFGVYSQPKPLAEWREGAFLKKTKPIMYAHGHHQMPETIVLTQSDYQRSYGENSEPMLLLQALWLRRLVFVGFGFSDAWLKFIGQSKLRRRHEGDPRHAAFVGVDSQMTAADRRLFVQANGVAPIFYPVENGDHGALLEGLRALAPDAPAATLAEPAAPAKPGVARAITRALRPPSGPAHRFVHASTEDAHYIGRADVRARLTDYAEEPSVTAIGVVGVGGLGKTSLIGQWLKNDGGMAARAVEGGLFWSMYQDQSVRNLLKALLALYRDLGVSVRHETDETRLDVVLRLMRAHPIWLALDGLEVTQEGRDRAGQFGALSGRLRDLIMALAQENPGLLILTSRYPFPDLMRYLGAGFRQLRLGALAPADGAELLRRLIGPGLAARVGPDAFEQASRRLQGHALGLRVLAQVARRLGEERAGDPLALAAAETGLEAETELGAKLQRMLRFYAAMLPAEDAALLGLLALFPNAQPARVYATLCERLGGALPQGLGEGGVAARLDEMVAGDGLVIDEPSGGGAPKRYGCHPVVRTHFRERGQAYAKASAELIAGAPRARPTSIEDVRGAIDAVLMLAEAGEAAAADEVARGRLESGVALQRLGAWRPLYDIARSLLARERGLSGARRGRWREFAGIAALNLGLVDEARRVLSERDNALAWNWLGGLEEDAGSILRAIDAQKRAIEKSEGQASSHINFAYLLGRHGRVAEAVRKLHTVLSEEALRKNMGDKASVSWLGGFYENFDEPSLAIDAFKRALAKAERDNSISSAHGYRLFLYELDPGSAPAPSDIERAHVALARANADRQQLSRALSVLSFAFLTQGDAPSALEAAREAVAESGPFIRQRASALRREAQAHLALEEPALALARVSDAIGIAEHRGDKRQQLECWRVRREIAEALDDADELAATAAALAHLEPLFKLPPDFTPPDLDAIEMENLMALTVRLEPPVGAARRRRRRRAFIRVGAAVVVLAVAAYVILF